MVHVAVLSDDDAARLQLEDTTCATVVGVPQAAGEVSALADQLHVVHGEGEQVTIVREGSKATVTAGHQALGVE